MGPHLEGVGAEGVDGLVEDLAAAAHDGDLRAVASELGSDLEADAGAPAGDQRHLPLEHVGAERRLHRAAASLVARDAAQMREVGGVPAPFWPRRATWILSRMRGCRLSVVVLLFFYLIIRFI
jgi:hypothetical protein